MASKVDIANAALEKLGQTVVLAAMTEKTKHAKALNRAWDRVRDFVLADHPWPFAVKAVALAELAQDPLLGWLFRYAYPADCLMALAVTTEDGVRGAIRTLISDTGFAAMSTSSRADFEVTHGDQATSIATDLEGAYLVYVTRVENTERFPPKFVEALACRLAWDRAGAVAGELGLQLRPGLLQDYMLAKSDAGAHAFNESRDSTAAATTPSIAARGA